ncbi:MAG: histidine phosphatase family protein [Caldilineales bacterium]|nr:histidine phosphatase family protein [Caldilineales bacterium]MDW8317496.1 histidine phosphatase family protein [Anaerolineae bacterium]
MRPTTLLLCRHGESEWNAQHRVQGQAPEAGGLTAEGRRQAALLARRLRDFHIDALYTSDLRRSMETAEIVAATLGLTPVADPLWREFDMGRWQGLTVEEVRSRWPVQQIREMDLPRGDTGETWAGFIERVRRAVDALVARHPGQTVAVVTHGGNVRASLLLTQHQDDPSARYNQPIPNTSITAIHLTDGRAWSSLVADAAHLDGHLTATNDDGR